MTSSMRLPPHSLEAEQSIIGSILIDCKVLDDIALELNPDDFYNKAHGMIFSAIVQMRNDGLDIDLVTLSDRLEKLELSDQCGGFTYLAELANNTPSSANSKSYARLVKEQSLARKLIGAVSMAADMAYQEKSFVGAQDLILSEMQKLTTDKGKSTVVNGDGLLNRFIERLEANLKSEGGLTGYSTGDKHIDEATGGFQPGDYIGLAAKSGGGKTTKALNIASHFCLEGRNVLIFSMETKAEMILQKMVSDVGSVAFSKLKSADMCDLEWHRTHEAAKRLMKNLYIDDSSGMSIDDVVRTARIQADKVGKIDLIVIDYIQRLKVDGSSFYAELTTASNRLKDLFMELSCAGIVLAQLKKNSQGRPNATDLRETGAIENDSDCLMFLHSDTEDSKPKAGVLTELIFNKVRYGETCIKLLRNALAFQRFEPVDGEAPEEVEDKHDIWGS